MVRLLGHFRIVLAGMISEPTRPLLDLPLPSDEERRQILQDWNLTAASYSLDKCLHHLFEQRVEEQSDGIAVVFEDEALTYASLNRRANQVAR